jgi:hypothetical protein
MLQPLLEALVSKQPQLGQPSQQVLQHPPLYKYGANTQRDLAGA